MAGGLPKIGIRPVIDGRRRGVRESLENQTMSLARLVASFISENLKHSCGLPVECVVADTCIGGVYEAAKCAEKFDANNVGATISVTPCWCYGSETMDMDPSRPKAVFGFNGTERPGAVYLAAALAAHNQKGLPAFGIYGRDVQDASDVRLASDVQEKLLRFSRAALAVASMRGKSYLSMGGTSMGIAGSMVNPGLLEKTFGMRSESVDMSEFVRRWDEGIYDKEEYQRAVKWVDENVKFGFDKNPPEVRHSENVKRDALLTNIKMTIIARDLMIGNKRLAELGFEEEAMGHNAIAGGFQGQRQWNDHFPNGDFLESWLCSSFDWNGIREPFVVATENDHLNGLAMLMGKLLTNTSQGFADVRTYWSPDAIRRVTGWTPDGVVAGGMIHLINSGAVTLEASGQCEIEGKPGIKPWWKVTPDEAARCVNATQYDYADLGYFRGGGYSSQLLSKGGMPITMSRLNLVDGLGPVLQVAEGWSVDVPDHVFDVINKRTDPTWPTTFFVPRVTGKGAFRDVYAVMENWGANHGAFSYGHVGADLVTLASMLRIPVNMHNVSEEMLYRPSAWAAFGTRDPEGADYRACEAFGPLYG
ncbi:MAG: L-fucose isomerase [Oscillospiraceae bacterium]|nr:L-fucose isomerase [Oscillospiraceae bacterium]